jgi:xanthine dehydrogenase accessory factor
MIAPRLQAEARALLARGTPAIDVLIAAHQGSVPRETGTRMLVTPQAVLGTIGGGHLEWKAIEAARRMLVTRQAASSPAAPDTQELDLPLGPALGQCCGGRVKLRLARLTAEALDAWSLPPPRFHLQLHGAGHVGRAIVTLLADIDCRVDWVDEREDEFPASDPIEPPHIARIASDAPEMEIARAAPGTVFLVMTHRHDLDERLVEAILRRGDAAFCGLIGSATKRARFLHRLGQHGLPSDRLATLHCPIGLPGLRGKEPAVLALSVVADLLIRTA